MPRNVEIKARVDELAALERRARALADSGPEEIAQEDVFFGAPHGRLKLRSFADGTGELIHYERPDTAGPSRSDYAICPTSDPAALRVALARACGEIGTVRKVRRLYLSGQTRIHLDRVEGLGDFVELEVVLRPDQAQADGERVARDLMASLGIEDRQLVEPAYVDLLAGR
jgi:predicted adenylyl cyclase CyaB